MGLHGSYSANPRSAAEVEGGWKLKDDCNFESMKVTSFLVL